MSNCYILHLYIWASTEYSFYIHFLHLSSLESAENCNILHLSIWESTNIAFLFIFCTCPIRKLQKIAILCTCPFLQVQKIAFSHFMQLSNWGSAENSYIMHQAMWEEYTYFCYWFLILQIYMILHEINSYIKTASLTLTFRTLWCWLGSRTTSASE